MTFDIICLQYAYKLKRGFMKLTKNIVEKASLPETGQRFLWDTELPGFGIRLTPTGRTYVVQARVNGKTRRVTIGKHGILTVQDARKKAHRELFKMSDGKDPTVEKKRKEANSATLKDITEKYLKARRDLKPSYVADIQKHLRGAFASWADRPATEITRDKVATRFAELTDRGPAQANQAFRVLRSILNYARASYRPDDKPIIIENPVSILSDAKLWNKVQPRSGRIPTDKIGDAWNLLQSLREAPEDISRTLADAVCFLILTGARWSEATELTWDRVNLEEGWWFLPDPKNRTPVKFPLSQLAIEILQARPHENTFVFPGRYGKGHIEGARTVFNSISKAIGVRVTAHDMRRTFRAIAAECGIEFWRTKLLMNHKMSGDITIAAYTEKSDLRYLAPEINLIGEWIARQATIAASDNVVRLKAKNGGEA